MLAPTHWTKFDWATKSVRRARSKLKPADGAPETGCVTISLNIGSFGVRNEDRPAPCPAPGLDVAPAVAHHEAGAEIDAVLAGTLEEQSRSGFAAIAAIAVLMATHQQVVQRQSGAHRGIDVVQRLTAEQPSRDFGLIRHTDEQEPGGLEAGQSGRGIWRYLQIGETSRGA